MSDYNYIDLFSGVGGFALGAHMAGMKFKEHFASEIDPDCVELYQLRFPDSIQLGDISKIDCDELKKKYGYKWILTGGFPCQNISCCGKMEGIHGEKSSLWFEYFRTIRELQPAYAVIENVGDISIRGLSTIVGNLASVDYALEGTPIQAYDAGFPTERKRVWIVAYPEVHRRERSLQNISEIIKKKSREKNALGSRCGYFLQFEKLFGEPAVLGMDTRISRQVVRLGMLGNSIVPQIAAAIWKCIKDILETKNE